MDCIQFLDKANKKVELTESYVFFQTLVPKDVSHRIRLNGGCSARIRWPVFSILPSIQVNAYIGPEHDVSCIRALTSPDLTFQT